MGSYCFGIDVGGTTVKCGLFQTDGTLVDKWEIPTRTENKGENILPDVANAINLKLEEKKIDKADVEGVGIGIPGPINSKGEAACAVNLYWGFTPVAQILHDLTGLKAKAGNDANVAALGEAWKGAAAGAQNVILVTLGTGVGGGIIVDGKVVAGFNGAGGEIGHITVNHDEIEACNCGQYGCLEQYTSATGIVRLAKRKLAKSSEETSIREIPNLTAKDVFDAAKAGDTIAIGLVDEVCEILGSTLSNIACVVNPEIIVIGGGVSKAGDILLDNIKKHFVETAFMACRDTKFALAGLGNDAGMYGCVEMLLD